MNVTFLGGTTQFFTPRRTRNFAAPRSQRFEDRVKLLHGFLWATNHHAVAAVYTPHAATGAYVHVMDTFFSALLRTANVIFEIGVAAVDDNVTRLHAVRQLLDRLFGRTPRRHHDPCRARGFQLSYQIVE